MTLRRAALKRRTELRPTPMPRRARELKARATRTARRQQKAAAATGPDAATRAIVLARSDGYCERCGLAVRGGTGWVREHSFHHRRPRGMGGSRAADTNSPANLLLLCGTATTGCHRQVEANRHRALDQGLLVPQGHDPATVPVATRLGWILLDHDGGWTTSEGSA